MQDDPKQILPGQVYRPTETKHVAKRGSRYIVRWGEDRKRRYRSFSSYEAACAFVRDYVIPHKEQRALPPSALAPGKGDGWVYAFQSGGPDSPVKVGWSSDPARRLRDVSGSHPYRLELVILIPGTRLLERAMHRRLREYRLEGEWFSKEAIRVIAETAAGGFNIEDIVRKDIEVAKEESLRHTIRRLAASVAAKEGADF